MALNKIIKFMGLILRHKPEEVDELITGISATTTFNMDMLEEIVKTDNMGA